MPTDPSGIKQMVSIDGKSKQAFTFQEEGSLFFKKSFHRTQVQL